MWWSPFFAGKGCLSRVDSEKIFSTRRNMNKLYFCPPPHEVRKGGYWIRHRLSVCLSFRPSVHFVSKITVRPSPCTMPQALLPLRKTPLYHQGGGHWSYAYTGLHGGIRVFWGEKGQQFEETELEILGQCVWVSCRIHDSSWLLHGPTHVSAVCFVTLSLHYYEE